MKASVRSRRPALAIGALALVALVVALAPGAQASGTYSSCPNKKITFKLDDGQGGTTPYSVVVKTISVKGISCAAGYEFLRDSYNSQGAGEGGYPQGYKCKSGQFEVPLGYIPQICAKGSKAIKYAAQGG